MSSTPSLRRSSVSSPYFARRRHLARRRLGLEPLETRNLLTIGQEFYIPLPEDSLRTSLIRLYSGAGATLDSTIAIAPAGTPGLIYYDQWEDGYEANIESPVQSTTQVWGDNNPANGIPPGFATDVLAANSVITLRNNITTPRSASPLLYDGRDRVATTKSASVTRSAWATVPGTVLADAIEVVPINNWGLDYVAPIGQNAANAAFNQMYEYVSMFIMASTDATNVQIDKDGNGTFETTVTLNRGQNYFADGGVLVGARVLANKPVEVSLVTGDVGSLYESRWYSLYPRTSWGSAYYTPVGTTQVDDPSMVFLYNPATSAIQVVIESAAGTQTVTVPASTDVTTHGIYAFTMPSNSGAHFHAVDPSKQFFAIGAMDADQSGSGNNVHDWGYTLVPDTYLTPSLKVGWAPGTGDVPISGDGSPVWVTAVDPTRIYVDYDGSPTTGPLIDPNGNHYDVHYDVVDFQSIRVYDPDRNQTGMRLYTLNGVKLAGAWGQDPSTAGAGVPFLDVGYTVLPQPVFYISKFATIVVGDGDGFVDPGEMIEYSVVVRNDGVIPLFGLTLTDPLPANTAYVGGTTVISNVDGSGAVSIPDNGTGTPYPLDGAGFTITTLAVGEAKLVRFRVVASTPIPPGTTQITNTAVITGGDEPLQATVTLPVQPAIPATCGTVDFTNSSFTPVTSYVVDSTVYMQVSDSDANTNSAAVQQISVLVTAANSGDRETLTLTETGVNTGVFRGSIPSSSSTGQAVENGTLYVLVGDTLTGTYTDPTCAGGVATDTAGITGPIAVKPLYLSTDGVDSDTTGTLDRIDPVHVTPADTTTSQSAILGAGGSSTVALAATTSSSTTSGTSLTFSHTPGSGTNRLLLVGIGLGSSDVQGDAGSVTGVTFGGTPMTLVNSATPPSGNGVKTYLYSLTNPGSAAANVVISATGVSPNSASIAAGATTFTGVNQSTPLGTSVIATSGGSTSTSVTVSSATGELVYAVGAWDEGGSNQSITVSSGQTSLWEFDGTNYVSAGASTKPGAASVTSTFTAGDSQENGLVSVPIKPATGGGSTSATFTQTPALSSALSLPAGSSIGAQAYVEMVTGTPTAGDGVINVTASLATGSPAFPSLGSPTSTLQPGAGPNGGAVYLLQWSAALASTTAVASGSSIVATLATTDSDFSFRILYDSNTYPSKITLPTTTFINVDSLAVYDTAYSNDGVANDGSVVTSVPNGQTVYVRALVSDPFGANDITSFTMNISPGVGAVIPARIIPLGSSGQALYEYAWTTGVSQGTFDITVRADEGYEGNVFDTAGTQLVVSFVDIGTPSVTEFTDGNNGPQTATYPPGGLVCVRVTDIDQNLNAAVAETVTAVITTSTGDLQTITLTETGVNTGVFTSCLPGSTTINVPNDGIVHDPSGTGLAVTYTDPNDAGDISSDTATVPAGTPQMTIAKTLLAPATGVATVGDSLLYRIVVFNTGNVPLTGVTVDDDFASLCMSIISATPAPVSFASDPLHWNLGTLAPGASTTIETQYAAIAPCTIVQSQNTATGDSVETAPLTSSASVLIAGRIAGQVLNDVDADGNPGDPDLGINGVTVTLYNDVNGNGLYDSGLDTFVATTATATDGSYEFAGLPGGNYVVVETDLGGYSSTWDAVGANNNQIGLTLLAGEAINGRNFLDTTVTLPDVSLVKQISNPAPLVGSTVTFTLAVSNAAGAGPATGVSVTDAIPAGYTYVASSIAGGDTRSDASLATGLQWTINTLAPGSTVNLTYQAVVLAAGPYANYAEVTSMDQVDVDSIPNNGPQTPDEDDDFTITPVPIPLATISGAVLADTDGNGTGDVGLAGVHLTLYTDPNGDGDPSDGAPVDNPNLAGTQDYVVTTNGSGVYTFTNVAPGSYVIVQTQPAGYLSVSDGDTTTPGDDAANASPTDNRIPVSVVSGETDDGNNFVEVQAATISGAVLADTDNNGTGDVGVPGVQLTLYTDPNGDGNPADGAPVDDPNLAGTQNYVVTTNGAGAYAFTNLYPGSYVIVETQPSGYNTISDGDTTDPGDDAPNTSLTDDQIPAAVTPGEIDDGNNFIESGNHPPVAVNDVRTGLPPGPVTLQVTSNDTDVNGDLNLATVDLDPSTPGRQTTLAVPGQGIWTVDNNGWVTFTPQSGFTFDPTPIPYTVQDTTGLTSNVATITLEFKPVATNNSSSGNTPGSSVTQLVPANDTLGDLVDPTTVRIVGGSFGGTTLAVPGEGVWSVNTSNGAVTFTPAIGFTDDPTPIRYTIQDFDGNVSNPALVIVDYVDLSCTGHPFTLVLDDLSTPQIDVIIVDDAPVGTPTALGLSTHADQSNSTLGEIYFSGSTAQFQLARTSAKSKPLVPDAPQPQIVLTSAFLSTAGGEIVVQATDSCYSVVSGGNYVFDSPIGGTTNGTVAFSETIDPANSDFATAPTGVTNTVGPFSPGTVTGSATNNFLATGSFASLAKTIDVTHPAGPKLTTLTAGGAVSLVSIDPRDVDRDGGISPFDALLVINQLNGDGPAKTTDAGGSAAPALDVNGDGWVSAADALAIINFLNAAANAEGQDIADASAEDAGDSQLGDGTLDEEELAGWELGDWELAEEDDEKSADDEFEEWPVEATELEDVPLEFPMLEFMTLDPIALESLTIEVTDVEITTLGGESPDDESVENLWVSFTAGPPRPELQPGWKSAVARRAVEAARLLDDELETLLAAALRRARASHLVRTTWRP